MKKSILFISIMSLISVSIVALILFINRNKNELTINDGSNNEIIESNSSIEEEEILDENITESIKDDASGVQDNDSSIHNSNKNDLESNSASNSNVIKESKTKEKKTSSQTVSKSEIESKQEVKETNNEDNTSVNKEEPKKQTPWEALGVSKYHYYNEPMYSWERVDFPVSKYGSEANCRKACAEYGDNYEPYKNGEVLYSCSIVTSLSGKYLGEYFSTEKLKFIDLKNVKLIGNSCFCNSGLVFANIASCVKLGRSAFDGCQNLKEVIMSFYIKTLPDRVFNDCFSLKKLDISNIEYFKTMCLANTGIKELVFSKDTKEVAEDALYRSKVKKLYFSQDFNTLNQNVLSSLEDLEIVYVDIEGVVPPNFLSYKNKLKKVIFTESVEKLGVGAVYFDKGLEMVVLKNKNIEISNKNFANCDKLEVLYYDNELEFKSISKRKSNNIKERKDVSKFKDIF